MKENESQSLFATMKNIWMNKREMSYPEAIFHLLSLPLFFKSRQVVFLAADYPYNRLRLIKDPENNAPGTDTFHDGIIEYYQARPKDDQFENMPLITFAAWYVKAGSKIKTKKDAKADDDDNDDDDDDNDDCYADDGDNATNF